MTDTSPELWWQFAVENFTHLSTSELPTGMQSGVSFTAVCVDVPRYLQHLYDSFQAAGGKVLKSCLPMQTPKPLFGALQTASEMIRANGLGEMDVAVNATGMGARALVGDEKVFPTKGQTILVKGESKFAKTTDRDHYVIPRPGSGTTILGGTREDGDWNTETSEEVTQSILKGCKVLAPELLDSNGDFKIVSVQCGLRPSRKGGPRIELEVVNGKYPVVHTYGHAGAGYQNAIGNAGKVVQLIKDWYAQTSLKAKVG